MAVLWRKGPQRRDWPDDEIVGRGAADLIVRGHWMTGVARSSAWSPVWSGPDDRVCGAGSDQGRVNRQVWNLGLRRHWSSSVQTSRANPHPPFFSPKTMRYQAHKTVGVATCRNHRHASVADDQAEFAAVNPRGGVPVTVVPRQLGRQRDEVLTATSRMVEINGQE